LTPPSGQPEEVIARLGHPSRGEHDLWWIDWQVIGGGNPGTIRKTAGPDVPGALISAMNVIDAELGSIAARGDLRREDGTDAWRFIPLDLFCLQ
jgi:hypothetical protein